MATGKEPTFVEHMECSVCFERYSLHDNVPKILPCGHTFCNICLATLVKNATVRVCCPQCQEKHSIPGKGVEGFPTNIVVTRMLDLACDSCGGFAQTNNCSHCNKLVCNTCLDDHENIKCKDELLDITEKAMTIKKKVAGNFTQFTEKVEGLLDGFEQLHSTTEKQMTEKLSIEDMKKMKEDIEQYIDHMNVVDGVISVDISAIQSDGGTGNIVMKHFSNPPFNPQRPPVPGISSMPYNNMRPQLGFGQWGSGPRPMNVPPPRMAVDGTVHVTDPGNNRIDVFSNAGGYITSYTHNPPRMYNNHAPSYMPHW